MFSSWPVSAFVDGVKSGGSRRCDSWSPPAVVLPARARDVSPHHALDRERLGLQHDHRPAFELVAVALHLRSVLGDVRGDHVVRHEIGEEAEPEERKLGEYDALGRDAAREDDVEGADAVGGDDQ